MCALHSCSHQQVWLNMHRDGTNVLRRIRNEGNSPNMSLLFFILSFFSFFLRCSPFPHISSPAFRNQKFIHRTSQTMFRYPLGVAFRRLPRRQNPSLHFLRTLRKRPGAFFAPNADKLKLHESPQSPLQQVLQHIQHQHPFLDPNVHYPAVEITDPAIMETAMEHTFEPFSSWNEIGVNQQLAPIAGSFIEFQMDNALVLGVVIAEPQSRFNEFHNKLIVLTMHNELVRVYPQDIHFSAYQVLEKDWIDSLDILTHRFNEQFAPRTRLVTVLHQFIACANNTRPQCREHLRITHSRLSGEFPCLTSLVGVLAHFPAQNLQSYFHQSAWLLCVHWEMCRDPARWVVASCATGPISSNIAAHRCSNGLPRVPVYLATPLDVFSSVSAFLQYDDTQLELLDRYIALAPRITDVALDLRFGAGRPFDKALRALLFGAFYPHERITGKTRKMSVFLASGNALLATLRASGLFSGDLLLSSGMVGKPANALAAATSEDVESSLSVLSSLRDVRLGSVADSFPHLRGAREYYHDMTVYALTDPHGGQIAFSLEKVNERKYLLNVHVPDVASRLTPSSRTFESWSRASGTLRSVCGLANGDKLGLLDQTAVNALLFGSASAPTHFTVGDMATLDEMPSYYCMTLTFEYNTYESDPLKNFGQNISVSFDTLRPSQIRHVDAATLESTLTGRLQPRLLDSFRLFGRTGPPQNCSLDHSDHFNVNFAYNTLVRHQLLRNRRCGGIVQPDSFAREISVLRDLETSVSVQKPSSGPKRSFFIRELRLFAGAMAAEYCVRNSIPVYHHTQSLVDKESMENVEMDEDSDEVFISHQNSLLPNYHGSSYFQTLLSRDSGGYISAAAYFIGNNYLGRKRLTVEGDFSNLPLGLALGYVDVAAMDSVEAYLNQLQILAHVHASLCAQTRGTDQARLKRFGYPVHGPFPASVLSQYTQRLEDAKLAANYLRDRQRRFWTLWHVHSHPDSVYHCVVTRVGTELSLSARLAWAYCEELAIEVHLYVENDQDISIGTRVVAGVLHVDPDSLWCVLASSEPF